MSIWDRFRRNREQSVLPDEVKQYYQSEKRQRRGVAFGLALVALLVTVAVAAALFFGGRFVYNQIRGDDKEDQGNSQDGQSDTLGDKEQQKQPDNSEGSANQQPSNPSPAPSPQQSTPAPLPTPAPTPSNPTTPALGDESLPHTGDEGL